MIAAKAETVGYINTKNHTGSELNLSLMMTKKKQRTCRSTGGVFLQMATTRRHRTCSRAAREREQLAATECFKNGLEVSEPDSRLYSWETSLCYKMALQDGCYQPITEIKETRFTTSLLHTPRHEVTIVATRKKDELICGAIMSSALTGVNTSITTTAAISHSPHKLHSPDF